MSDSTVRDKTWCDWILRMFFHSSTVHAFRFNDKAILSSISGSCSLKQRYLPHVSAGRTKEMPAIDWTDEQLICWYNIFLMTSAD
jgi:hypothetical protein